MTNSQKNVSCQNPPQNITYNNSWSDWDYNSIAILSSLSVAILAINSLVFFLFFKRKSLRTSSNYPLFSLAACDLFMGFAVIPLFIVNRFTPLIRSKSTRFYLGFLIPVFHTFVAIATIYHIVVVTAERYMAIKMPLKHRLVKKKTVYKVLALVWLIAAATSSIPFAWINMLYPNVKPEGMKLSLGYAILFCVVVVVLPYIFLVTAFVVMFKVMARGSSKKGSRKKLPLRQNSNVVRQKAGERKCLLVFATMAVAFAICWFPSFVVFLLVQLLDVETGHRLLLPSKVSLIIRYLTCIIDPLLYTFLKRDFSKALKSIFTRRQRRRSSTSVTTASRKGTLQTEADTLAAVSMLFARKESQRAQRQQRNKKEENDDDKCKLCHESPL